MASGPLEEFTAGKKGPSLAETVILSLRRISAFLVCFPFMAKTKCASSAGILRRGLLRMTMAMVGVGDMDCECVNPSS